MNVALSDTAHRERYFEEYIVKQLAARGWKVGTTAGYDQNHTLYPEDLVAWVQATQPKQWEKLVASNGDKATATLMDRLAQALERESTVTVLRNGTALLPPEGSIEIPSWVGRVDYEGELGVVIRKPCRRVPEEEALDYVLGYTCVNDVTARDLQRKDGQWSRAKGFDTFAPLGPVLLLTREMPPQTRVRTRSIFCGSGCTT